MRNTPVFIWANGKQKTKTGGSRSRPTPDYRYRNINQLVLHPKVKNPVISLFFLLKQSHIYLRYTGNNNTVYS
jgi:hypothetical protein